MSSSKAKAKNPPARSASRAFGFTRKKLLAAAVVIVVGTAAGLSALLYLTADTPETLVLRARKHLESDPAYAESLLVDAGADGDQASTEVRVLLCEALGRQHKWQAAHAVLTLVPEAGVSEPDRLLRFAESAASAGELAVAELALRRAVPGAADPAAILRRLIQVQTRLGRWDAVVETAARLGAAAPDDPFPRLAAGQAQEANKRVVEAQDAYEQALRLAKTYGDEAPARLALLRLHVQQGAAEPARGQFDALQVAARRANLLVDVELLEAALLRLEGKPDAALALVDNRLRARPGAADARMLRGVLLLDLNRPAEAASDLEYVIAHEPLNKESRYKLAAAYTKLGQTDKAETQRQISERLVQLQLELLDLRAELEKKPGDAELTRKFEAARQALEKTAQP